MRWLPKYGPTMGLGILAAALLLYLRVPHDLSPIEIGLVLLLLALIYYSISRGSVEQTRPEPSIVEQAPPQAVSQEIVEYRRVEAALRESEERYRTLVENLPLCIYEIGVDGRVQSINQSGRRMFGALSEDAEWTFLQIVPEPNRASMATLLARAAAAGEPLEIEHSGVVDQNQRMFVTSLIPLPDADGTQRRIMGMTQDITDRRQMQLDAEMERYRLDAVLESSNDAIAMVDLDSQLVLVNRAFSNFFGMDAEDMIGRDGETAFSQLAGQLIQPKPFLQALQALFVYPQHEAFGEVEIHSPRYRALAWYSGPVRTRADTSLGRLFFFRDATREKQADQLKTEFISIVSHELRTPLTSIKGFTELLLDGDAGEISPTVREFLEIVKFSADQLVGITNDILETTRIESGKIKLEIRPIVPARSIHRVAETIRPLINSKQQTLTIDLPADLPVVYADQERLAQILTNLLSNAHKYTPEHGSITVSAYVADRLVVRPGQRLDGPSVVITVTDTGIGIAPEDQVYLFTRFYRVSNADTHGIVGTGLGLNITRALVQMHGGNIWVESDRGRGSTFSFSLPLERVTSSQNA